MHDLRANAVQSRPFLNAASATTVAEVAACPTCGRDTRPGMRFCVGCGAALSLVCPSCGNACEPDDGFCGACGAALTATPPQPETASVDQGQRRHLTVLFSDLVDSTRLAGELDPEDMRDLVVAYQSACTDVVASHSGFVAQYLGDGVLAYFGYPAAHEDDPCLAVAAGLEIVQAMATLREQFGRSDLEARVGLHTGEVVMVGAAVGDAGKDYYGIGEAPNVAARLQSLALPGAVILSDRTRELVDGYYELESFGELTLKGVNRPVHAFQVLGATDARTRLDALAVRGLTPLYGRNAELAELLEHWDAVRDGGGRVVLLSGEPGIGKSRLAHELALRVSTHGGATLRLRSSPYNTRSSLFPFVEHLLSVVSGDQRESPSQGERLDRLERHLAAVGLNPTEAAPALAELLAIPDGGRYPASSDSAERRKRQMLDVIFRWLVAQANDLPLLVVVEDLQWIDPTTLDFLTRYFGGEPVPGTLIVLTHRADFVPQWPQRPHVRRQVLEPLGSDAIDAMVIELSDGYALPPAVAAEIGARCDGVPLYLEEVTHAVLASGWDGEESGGTAVATLPERIVPSTLRGSLMARLDVLGPSKEVAQVLSVVGREASFELLRLASGLDDASLEEGLDRLVDADIVRRRHSASSRVYGLKHWLVQDVAYESMLRSVRRQFHERIARALPTELPAIVETQPEFLAHHLLCAGLEEEAVTYLQRAGELAHRRSANTEAIEHLERALELVRNQPPSVERDQLELSLLISLGAPLTASKGYSVPEVEHVYRRAGELCVNLGHDTSSEFFRALYGTWRVHLLRADYRPALDFARQLLRLAEETDNGTHLGAAHRALGSTLFYLGSDPAAARKEFDLVIASHELERHRTSFLDELHDVVDPWITCHAYQAWSLWLTGRPTEARQLADRALALSQELQHPFTRALALSFDSWLWQWQGNPDLVLRSAGDAFAIATEQGFEFWIGWNEIMLGWATAARGDRESGLERMERGLDSWRAVGSELGTTYFLALIAETQLESDRLDLAWRSLDAADEVAEATGEGWWASEVLRIRGLVLKRRGAQDDKVEHELESALALARSHGSHALSLRAAVALAELRFEQGRDADGRALLEAELGSFAALEATQDAGVLRARDLLGDPSPA